MELNLINYIKSNPIIYNYLRINSSYYKALLRDPNSIKNIEEQAKQYFQLTPSHKIQKIKSNIEMISSLMDVFK